MCLGWLFVILFCDLRTCGTFTFGLLIEQAVCRKASCGVGHVPARNSWTVTALLPWLPYANGTTFWLHRYWLHKKQDLVSPTLRYINFSLLLVRLILHGMPKFSPYFEKGHSSVSLVSMLRPARLSKYIRLPVGTERFYLLQNVHPSL